MCLCAYSLVAQRLKHLPPLRETQIRSLGREDPLEKEMAAHSSILAWRIPWTEKPGRLQSTGSQWVGHDWATSLSFLSHEHLLFTSPAGMQGKDTCPQQMSWKRSQNRADCQKPNSGVQFYSYRFLFLFFFKGFQNHEILQKWKSKLQSHISSHR